jgi:hypothetical protein
MQKMTPNKNYIIVVIGIAFWGKKENADQNRM